VEVLVEPKLPSEYLSAAEVKEVGAEDVGIGQEKGHQCSSQLF
jgi:hypothetical protein